MPGGVRSAQPNALQLGADDDEDALLQQALELSMMTSMQAISVSTGAPASAHTQTTEVSEGDRTSSDVDMEAVDVCNCTL